MMSEKGGWLCPLGETCSNLTTSINSSHVDMDEACLSRYLEKYLGLRRSSAFLPICLIYLVIFMVGVLGNVLTCTVIARNKVMWTPTNYYLFSLAVSDLLVLLLGMPLELYELWQNYPFLFGKAGCHFKTFLFETVCLASILNVTALSVERYIAVVHPLRAKYVVTRTHAKRVIITVWGVSVLCAIPNTGLHGIAVLQSQTTGPTGPVNVEIPDSAICTLVKPLWMYNLTIQVTTLLFFAFPMLIISILYLLIGLQLKREKMHQALEAKSGFGKDSFCNIRTQQQKARRQQVTKMLCEYHSLSFPWGKLQFIQLKKKKHYPSIYLFIPVRVAERNRRNFKDSPQIGDRLSHRVLPSPAEPMTCCKILYFCNPGASHCL